MRYVITVVAACVATASSADTIYLCEAYSGGKFWSSSHCHQHKALIDRIETVPDGLPFDQQVQLAQSRLKSATPVQPTPRADDRVLRCNQLKAQRDSIWSRYNNWQYNTPDVVGEDRSRWIAIQREQAALRCPNQ